MVGLRSPGRWRRFIWIIGAALASGVRLAALDAPGARGIGVVEVSCETCAPSPIACGATIEGRLAAGDCERAAAHFLDLYRLELTEPGPVTIDLRSAPLDPVLFLLDGACVELVSNDDCEPNDLDRSCVTADLPAGTYHIGVSSLEAGEAGDYLLEVTCPDTRPCRDCEVGTAPCGGGVLGILEAGDCPAGGFPADVWRLDLPAPSSLDVALTSAADLGLELLDASCRVVASSEACAGEGLASCLRLRQVAAGTHAIRVKGLSGDGGGYGLRVDCAPFDPCRSCIEGTVACGGRVEGALAEGDCILGGAGTLRDAWSLRLEEPRTVAIDLESPGLDAVLVVLDASCREVASGGCAGRDPCLVLDLPAGDHTVVVNGSHAGATGPYSLRVDCAANPFCAGCRAGTIPCSGSVSASLPATGCKGPDGSFIDVYDLSLSADSQVDVRLRASFDTLLRLADSGCNVLATNDDCTEGDTGRSCLSVGLQAGSYAVWVSSLVAGETGDYTLEVESADCAPCDSCRVGAVACGGAIEWTLPASGCRLPGKLHLDVVDLRVAEPGDVMITVESEEFDPSLTLRDASCSVIASNDDCDASTLNACLTVRLEPGTYSAAVNSFLPGEWGSCRLSVACGGRARPGDCNADRVFNIADAICLLGFLFDGVPGVLPCGDGRPTDAANVSLLDYDGGGKIDISDAVAAFLFLFVNGPPHALGRECVPIAGCRDDC
jgi:hypothetical protein